MAPGLSTASRRTLSRCLHGLYLPVGTRPWLRWLPAVNFDYLRRFLALPAPFNIRVIGVHMASTKYRCNDYRTPSH